VHVWMCNHSIVCSVCVCVDVQFRIKHKRMKEGREKRMVASIVVQKWKFGSAEITKASASSRLFLSSFFSPSRRNEIEEFKKERKKKNEHSSSHTHPPTNPHTPIHALILTHLPNHAQTHTDTPPINTTHNTRTKL